MKRALVKEWVATLQEDVMLLDINWPEVIEYTENNYLKARIETLERS